MRTGLTNLEAIAYLSTQPEGLWDVKPHEEDKTDSQRRLYWKILGVISESLREPKAYVHNYCLRLAEFYDGNDCVPIPDTDDAELKTMYNQDRHLKPTHDTYEANGKVFRLYRKLRGVSKLSVKEMSLLIDIAINQMTDMGLMLPQDEATLKAYEEHKRGGK